MPHDIEAAEEIDVFALRRRGNQRDHALSFGLCDDLWRELRIDQYDIGADRPNFCEAGADQRIVPAEHVTTDDGIRSELPQHKIGFLRKNSRIEPAEHVGDFLAGDAAIEHGERQLREMLLELDCKPARIVCGGRARTGSRCRRRADGNDRDRFAGSDFLRETRKRISKADEIERRNASRSGSLGARRRNQRQPREQGGGGHRCL